MSRIISRAESFERAYEAFNEINFNAFDFNTIKQSLLDYMKLYYPEDFNDFIGSSEFIAVLEIFAYVGELLAYRLDINAHENFITTAQRKDSILRLAKLISYTAARNIPARGLVKITSVQTTQQVIDSNNVNLAGVKVNWNDTNNVNWKEQFFLIMNLVLEQEFGSVAPTERVQVDDVLFELYGINNNPLNNGVFSYTANVSGETLPMELVPASLESTGPEERRPDNISGFRLLYGNDGLGDGSNTTGFFCFTKQGTLTKETTTFDGVTPNQTFEVSTDDINDVDVWLNNVDPNTSPQETIDDGTVPDGVSGEWVEVDLANAQNIIFNTLDRRQKYEIETLDDDQIRLVFGDGEFADIPSGTFDIWYRVSANTDTVIPETAVINQTASFTYNDSIGNIQTLTFTFSLISSLQNASPTEDIEHIRRVAPSVYYTQDRMVNDRDYNVFMLQDPTILKLRSVNRTFAGDSKWIGNWYEPSETYENVKIFGCDLALYLPQDDALTRTGETDLDVLIDSYIEPILSTPDFFTTVTSRGVANSQLRKNFTTGERTDLTNALLALTGAAATPLHIYLGIEPPQFGDFQFRTSGGAFVPTGSPEPTPLLSSTDPIIKVEYDAGAANGLFWTITQNFERLVGDSQQTRFWNTNTNRVIDYDSIESVNDSITIFQANVNDTRQGILTQDFEFKVLDQELDVNENRDIHRLRLLPFDTDTDGIPDNNNLDELLDGQVTISSTGVYDLPFPMLLADFDGSDPIIQIRGALGGLYIRISDFDLQDENGDVITGSQEVAHKVDLLAFKGGDTSVTLYMRDFVYQSRETSSDNWELETLTDAIITSWYGEVNGAGTYPDNWESGSSQYRRFRGRYDLNFAWFHFADRFRLIDPAQTNIIDTFIITRGYYNNILDWLSVQLTNEPSPPTPLDLRITYGYLLDSKMISDTLVLHPGQFKILFGSKAITQLQATIKVVRSTGNLTDNQVRTRIVGVVQSFFDVNLWEFGETFFFTELAAAIHNDLKSEIDSVVLVPLYSQHQFGDLYQVLAREDEIFQADIGVEDIEIVQALSATVLRQDI